MTISLTVHEYNYIVKCVKVWLCLGYSAWPCPLIVRCKALSWSHMVVALSFSVSVLQVTCLCRNVVAEEEKASTYDTLLVWLLQLLTINTQASMTMSPAFQHNVIQCCGYHHLLLYILHPFFLFFWLVVSVVFWLIISLLFFIFYSIMMLQHIH